MAEYWLEVQMDPTEEGGESPHTLPLAWFAYAEGADTFARVIIKMPGVKGIGRGREGRAHTKKWGTYEPTD